MHDFIRRTDWFEGLEIKKNLSFIRANIILIAKKQASQAGYVGVNTIKMQEISKREASQSRLYF